LGAEPFPSNANMTVWYEKPSDALQSTTRWRNRAYNSDLGTIYDYYFEINQSCWDYNSTHLKLGIIALNSFGMDDNLVCFYTDTDYIILDRFYSWYYEEAMYWNSNGYTGVETQINNITPSEDQNWTFSCRVYDGVTYGDWVNSSTVATYSYYIDTTSSDIDTGLRKTIAWFTENQKHYRVTQ